MSEKTKILIGDDEPLNLNFFEVMLSRLGFEVILASGGEEALEKITESRPDLIMVDNLMRGLSGWELTRLLKQDRNYRAYRDIPIIMFSALDSVKDKIEGFELGVEDYITKPYNFSEVLARIRSALRRREMARRALIDRERAFAWSTLVRACRDFGQEVSLRAAELAGMLEDDRGRKRTELLGAVRELQQFSAKTLRRLIREERRIENSAPPPTAGLASLDRELEDNFKSQLEDWNRQQEAAALGPDSRDEGGGDD
ncbi:MAG: response regulator [Spirochaetales bacterium]|jgi:DNA-binding response OmpR family regulator|nr:response regulator [Spirochaetales bacterium]